MSDEELRPDPRGAFERFVERVPELQEMWRAHLADHGEPLLYVFMGEVAQYAVHEVRYAPPELRQRFARALDQLAASSDDKVHNIVGVSFFETLVLGERGHLETLDSLRPHLGPAALGMVEAFETMRDAMGIVTWQAGDRRKRDRRRGERRRR